MRFRPEIGAHLAGERFSNGLAVEIATPERRGLDRLDHLADLCRGRRVVHVGFADHAPLIVRKRARGEWLHDRLRAVTTRCLGVDTDAAAVAIARGLGIPDVHRHDLMADPPLADLMNAHWEVMLLGEVLEHVDNPVAFLASIAARYGAVVDEVIITVPNAFDLTNLRHLLRHRELINTDHRYWFTPYTLAKVGTRAGLRVIDFAFCQSYPPGGRVGRLLVARYPQLRESIAMRFAMPRA